MRSVAILPLFLLSVTAFSAQAQDQVPLTPVPSIGVNPASLDFGCVDVTTCRRGGVTLFNEGEPGSLLRIIDLVLVGEGFSLLNPPSTPFIIPPTVALSLEFCPRASGPATGTLTIESDNAPNSPLTVSLEGLGNEPPVCDAGGPYRGEVGFPIQFDATASTDPDGTIIDYQWDFGDGNSATGPLPTHTYDTPGLFTVNLQLRDDCNGRSECETSVDVAPRSTPIIGVDPAALYYGVCNPIGQCIDLTIELFNDVPDPLIILTVTDLTVTGDGFMLVSPPALPLEIPGGGAVETLTLRFCPIAPGGHAGTLTVTAPGAFNSPLGVQLAGAGPSNAGGYNPHATLPLHALLASSAPCSGYLPVDCDLERPTVNVPPNTDIVVFLLVSNQNDLAGLQTAFEWHSSWQLLGSFWDCQPGQMNRVVPRDPGGPTAGTISTAFDCFGTTDLAVIGRMFMRTGPEGCLRQVPSTFPCETYVVDCNQNLNQIDRTEPHRLGTICTHSGGVDACDVSISVEPTTWGAIKHSYR